MINIFGLKLFQRKYEPLNKVIVFKEKLLTNYKYLSNINPALKVVPVLKSNAYGHGIRKIANFVDQLNAPFIAVDSIYEAYELLKQNVKSQILIMGYVEPRNLRFKKLPFSYAVFSFEYAKEILRYQPQAKLHLFVDTGMCREGMQVSELKNFQFSIFNFQTNIEGIMTHLASADESQKPQTDDQLNVFNEAIKICADNNIFLKYKHASASFGLLNYHKNQDNLNVVRSGFGFYGYMNDSVKPALRLTSKIAQIKKIKKGDLVGYNATFEVNDEMTIAILPIGYANGILRSLSNAGVVQIKGVECPIIGRISMNITTVDISQVKNVKIGDEVIVISENPEDKNSVKSIARICNTIEYEILVRLDPSIRRELV